jgi:hypothetical protein
MFVLRLLLRITRRDEGVDPKFTALRVITASRLRAAAPGVGSRRPIPADATGLWNLGDDAFEHVDGGPGIARHPTQLLDNVQVAFRVEEFSLG